MQNRTNTKYQVFIEIGPFKLQNEQRQKWKTLATFVTYYFRILKS